MGLQLKDLLHDASVLDAIRKESVHRTKNIINRPEERIELHAVESSVKEYVKTQKDPTDDLVWIPNGLKEDDFVERIGDSGYLVWCKDTLQTWYAATELILNKNFIYRDDLVIDEFASKEMAWSYYVLKGGQANPDVHVRETCYILDNPANETYEVYYDSAYPSRTYGKATPQGMFVHKYLNRFHRDMAILQLDALYSNASQQEAQKFTQQALKSNEAIIISDGAWMREVSSSAIVYMDNESLIRMTEARNPSDADQAVLISEIKAATNALQMVKFRGKKKVTYYYDNTSILNVFKNRKTEYIDEIKRYKELCESMIALGYQINFVELHPKTGENRDTENKALMFFHNMCDAECRTISDIYRRKYISNATTGSKDGQVLNRQNIQPQRKGGGKPNHNNRR